MRFARSLLLVVSILLATYYGICTLLLALYTIVLPPVTGVHIQRRVEALFDDRPYEKHYDPVPRAQISASLVHAIVAAEDTRFYEHSGIDWKAVREAIEENLASGEIERGGSTITQQLVKNLFMTTHSSFMRKALEVPLTYLAELILSKERILTLYLNVIEWDHGVYGAQAAAEHYYGIPAAQLSRYQSAALAAVIPDPLGRSPAAMDWYTRIILGRMNNLFQPGGAPVRQAAPPTQRQAADTSEGPDMLQAPPVRLDPLEAAPPAPTSPDSARW